MRGDFTTENTGIFFITETMEGKAIAIDTQGISFPLRSRN
jgi:hypothetical protein